MSSEFVVSGLCNGSIVFPTSCIYSAYESLKSAGRTVTNEKYYKSPYLSKLTDSRV